MDANNNKCINTENKNNENKIIVKCINNKDIKNIKEEKCNGNQK